MLRAVGKIAGIFIAGAFEECGEGVEWAVGDGLEDIVAKRAAG